MSVANQFKNLFSKKTPDSEQDSRMSLATPEGTYGQTSADTMLASTDHAPLAPQDNATGPVQDDLLAPAALENPTHQKLLDDALRTLILTTTRFRNDLRNYYPEAISD